MLQIAHTHACVHTHTHAQIFTYLLSQHRRATSNGRPVATTVPNILNKRNQNSLGKCLFVGLCQETHKMFLKHLTVPERRQVPKQTNEKTEILKEQKTIL